jgi:hypothetical protein
MIGMRNAKVRKAVGKKLFGRPTYRRKHNIKMGVISRM